MALPVSGCLAAANTGTPLRPNIIGASADMRLGFYETVDAIAKMGFRTIEVQENNQIDVEGLKSGKNARFCLNPVDPGEQERIRQSVAGFDHVTAHLPWTRLNFGGPTGPASDASVLAIEEGIKVAGRLKASVTVIHARPGEGISLEETHAILLTRIRRWGDLAAKLNVRLAVETGTPPAVRDFVNFIHEINHPNVGATLDVGHQKGDPELRSRIAGMDRTKPEAIRAYNDTNIWLVKNLGAKLFHLHVHDIDPATWSEHEPIHFGFIDYPRLLTELQAINYPGVLVLEIGPMDGMERWLPEAKKALEQHLLTVQTRSHA